MPLAGALPHCINFSGPTVDWWLVLQGVQTMCTATALPKARFVIRMRLYQQQLISHRMHWTLLMSTLFYIQGHVNVTNVPGCCST